ncbi:hypothetical protein Tco_0920436 [Tanacetum coccineum]
MSGSRRPPPPPENFSGGFFRRRPKDSPSLRSTRSTTPLAPRATSTTPLPPPPSPSPSPSPSPRKAQRVRWLESQSPNRVGVVVITPTGAFGVRMHRRGCGLVSLKRNRVRSVCDRNTFRVRLADVGSHEQLECLVIGLTAVGVFGSRFNSSWSVWK